MLLERLVLNVSSIVAIAFSLSVHALDDWQPLPSGVVTRIAFGSCAKHWQAQPIWQAVLNAEPDLFLFLGDAIYADTDGKTAWKVNEQQLRGEWNRLADKPEFQAVRAKIPFMATWDNHDYGSHNGGAWFEMKTASREAFLDFFGEPADSERRGHPGVYDSRIFGDTGRRVQVILLDTRYFKGPFIKDPRSKAEKTRLGVVGNYLPNPDPEVTLLGTQQWEWLETQLGKPAEVRLIASSTQIVADQKGMDEWGNYPHERHRLFDLIAKSGATGVVLLSGNVHFAEISKLQDGPYPLYDVTSSGMTHVNTRYATVDNPYRIAGPYIDLNFGLIEINWEAEQGATVTLKVIGVNGNDAFQQQLSLDRLRLRPTK